MNHATSEERVGAGTGTDNGKPLTEAEIAKARTILSLTNGDEAAAEEHLVKHGMSPERAAKAVAIVTGADAEGFKVELVDYDTIEAEIVEWLWAGKIPHGMLTLLIGTEGHGKSAAMLRLAALLTRGGLPGEFYGDPQKVAILTVEDDPSRTIKPRLMAAGADMGKAKHMKLSENGEDTGFILPRDGNRIGQALGAADVRLVIVDPLAQILDPRVDSYKDTDVRRALTPLLLAAAEHDFAVLGALHTNKTKTGDARERAMGSVGWRQVVRSALHLGIDPDDPDGKDGSSRVIAHDKCNVGPKTRSRRFELVEEIVPITKRDRRTGEETIRNAPIVRAEFGEECDHSADALVAAEAGVKREDIGGKKAEAAAMLHALLADAPMAVEKIREEAGGRDIGWRTVEDAKKEIGIVAERPEGSKAWVWKLPLQFHG